MKYPASHLTPFPPTFPGKITCKRILIAKNSARAPASPLSTFRMNTCKSVSKQRTLSPSRMNTYAKTGGRGVLLLTASAKRRCSGRASGRSASAARARCRRPHSIHSKSICDRPVIMNLRIAPSNLSICISHLFINLRIAFFATHLFSKTSALPPSFFNYRNNSTDVALRRTTHYPPFLVMLS
jgi:hypothetical protein